MHSVISFNSYWLSALLVIVGFMFSGVAFSNELEKQHSPHAVVIKLPATLTVSGELAPPASGVTDLKFWELFKLPVGSRGLEPSEKLISLNGKHVRMVGYMAKEETPTPGRFILSPLPVNMGDEDESFADDLPASAVFVHMEITSNGIVPYIPGLIKVAGILQFGSQDESDGRISTVRLILDPALALTIMENASSNAARTRKENEVVVNE